ncbi:MAG: hypothetical protein QME68_06330 [Elusimicrobiota bacterium]|nr:hypothetical protein [Elusimicrobiota bacterium]
MSRIVQILIFILIILVAFFIGKTITSPKPVLSLVFVGAVIFTFVAFHNIQHGLIILVFSMLLSPELKIAEVPGRLVVIRFDDLILILLFVIWLAQMAIRKELGLFTKTPLNLPIGLYTLLCVLFTFRGMILDTVIPKKAIFYLLKYVEYFLVYLITVNIVKSKEQLEQLLIAGLITFLIVCFHGYSLLGKAERLYAPFDYDPGAPIGTGEAASLGGYLLIVMSVILGLFCYSPMRRLTILFGGSFLFALIPFAYTLSRASFFGFVPMFFLTGVLTHRRKTILLIALLLGVAFAPMVLPKPVEDVSARVQETFAGPGAEEEVILGFKVRELSALARIKSWKRAFTEWIVKEPLMGFGLSGVGLVDTQIPLVIGELGLIGLAAFIWLIFSVGRNSLRVFHTVDNWIAKGLSQGLFCALVGLLFQSVAVNTFIIIRIMEPFWFLTGLVMMLPEIYKKEQNTKL